MSSPLTRRIAQRVMCGERLNPSAGRARSAPVLTTARIWGIAVVQRPVNPRRP